MRAAACLHKLRHVDFDGLDLLSRRSFAALRIARRQYDHTLGIHRDDGATLDDQINRTRFDIAGFEEMAHMLGDRLCRGGKNLLN